MSKVDRTSATLSLDEGVNSLKGVSHARTSALAKMGIHSVRDLLTHYPRRYIDLTTVATIAGAPIGSACTIVGKVVGSKFKRPRPHLPIVEVSINDGTATMIATFFRMPWLKDKFVIGSNIVVAGKCEFSYGFLRMTNPFFEVQEDDIIDNEFAGKIVPIHPATAKMSAVAIRKTIHSAIANSMAEYDPLPLDLRLSRGLVSKSAAISAIHFPTSMDEMMAAKERLVYEELFYLQLFLMRQSRLRTKYAKPVVHNIDGSALRRLKEALPFELTADQKLAVEDILNSLAEDRITSRMVLGDVGSGKTIVAAFGFAAAKDTGTSALFMAPTEVLANQHFLKLSPILEKAGISCALLTGSTPKDEREAIKARLLSGELSVLIGTHALLEPDIQPKNLSLVVIDEQQRFGVGQRATLLEKGSAPDAIFLTATPIPRTLALALFGGLELSYIKERPVKGARRQTCVVPRNLKGKAYDAAVAAVNRGEQVFVVCPLIGIDSDERKTRANAKLKFADDDQDAINVIIDSASDFQSDNVASAIKEAQFLQDRVFVNHKVGLLHGAMSSEEKALAMQEFQNGETSVLVATTVIEVGIDIPNATVMIVEDADRFGLSQLHQLRGRVGRANLDSEVYLISASESEDAISRLRMLEQSDDGFEISTFDLSLRREGDLLGFRQSGASILKLVDITRDGEIIEQAHVDACAVLKEDPDLHMQKNAGIARELRILFAEDSQVDVG